VEFVNQRWREYAGLSAEESQGWGWQAAIHPEDFPSLMENSGRCCGPENQGSSGLSRLIERLCPCKKATLLDSERRFYRVRFVRLVMV
jgi:PAS domain-containing protein